MLLLALSLAWSAPLPDGPAWVVGGQPAENGRWPDAGYITFGAGACTGTLIDPRYVLTAAHCVEGASQAGVLFNQVDSGRVSEGVAARSRRLIPYRMPWNGSYDIALIELDEPITTIAPRGIGRDCVTEQWLVDGAEAWIVGWGMVDAAGTQSTDIQQEGVTYIDTADCSVPTIDGMATGCEPNVNPGGEIGAGGEGVDACFGDSGGPLYLPTPTGVWLVGVTSRSYAGVNPSFPCRDGGIWTRPDAVIDWIEQTIGEPLPPAYCSLPPVLELDEVRVPSGGSRRLDVRPPDADGEVSYKVVRQPLHGQVTISDDGWLTVAASPGYRGIDSFVFGIGQPNPDYPDSPVLYSEMVVDVTIGGVGFTGCSTTGGAAPGALLTGLVAALARRRPRR